MSRRIWKLDGKKLDNREYITVKVKVPIHIAKGIVSDFNGSPMARARIYTQAREQLERRLTFETIKTYTLKDVRVGLVYEFKDAKHNRYMIAAVDESTKSTHVATYGGIGGKSVLMTDPKVVIIQRLNDNKAGKAGELIASNIEKILTYLNDDMAVVIGYIAPNYEQALMLP